ncbi:aromatic ring-hydroxylating dioxygenase subunit alpha [Stenotrophomonas sp. MMGLT7]|uniref:aromatic ring-hydroxylating dioxygenase subunit alpha n=1 Tax=Stenotrophomonas sp. MMGLT7 TaxID=2901227 RepID=UPI001E3DE855|nr:aromatic ring-hydroxylating dioxygenase subunit alpha [Stenotrophomonas sp. MMGLT7]MCD7099054.1 aromatic ring-hydroxylating dioxygenase subunit alpha [Stenotrophomonas sp. MMGLT7]
MDAAAPVVPLDSTFDPDDWHRLAQHWHAVALGSEVGAAPVKATLLDEQLVLYRFAGELVAARDVCPHRGVPLSMGFSDGEGVVCPYHGLRFGAGGRCNRIPANPNQAIPGKMKLRSYAVVERYGLVWVCLARPPLQPGEQADIPAMPHWDDAGFQQIVCPGFDIAGSAGRQLEGFIDVAHFAWIHTGTFADPNNQEVPAYTTSETPSGFNADYLSSVGNYPIGVDGKDPTPPGFQWLRHFEVHLPFTATLTIHFPTPGQRLVIMNAASPVSAHRTRLFVPIARNFDTDLPVEDVHAFNLRVFEEDRAMVESQKPEYLPLDPLLEVHIPADRSSIAYRRALRGKGYSDFFLR